MTISPAVAWVLRAAYGPPGGGTGERHDGPPSGDAPPSPGPDFEPEKAAALAAALGLDLRLAARIGAAGLAATLGQELATGLQEKRRREAARGVLLLELASQVAVAAEEADGRAVLLKGAALLAAGVVAPGARRLLDVDVLVAQEAGERLCARLLGRGFQEHPAPEGSEHHHAPPLFHPHWGTVEIHFRIPGVGAGGPGDATAQQLFAHGLCRPAPAGQAWLPAPGVMAAHAVAHARVQNRNVPGPALFLCVADLLDLAAAEGGLEPLLDAAAPMVTHSLPAGELEALAGLGAALAAGEAVAPESPPGQLLGEGLATALDPTWRRRLWRRRLAQRLRGGQWRRLLRAAARRLGRR